MPFFFGIRVRNDLGRVAEIGSIFTKHRSIRRCGDLFHAEQKIHAQLQKDRSLIDAIQATFPPGSITGAPKIAAMRLIHELESHTRGIYTGSLGFFSHNHKMNFNVAIRTLYIHKDQASLCVGCGIVADSNPEKEWQESLAKGMAISKSLFT